VCLKPLSHLSSRYNHLTIFHAAIVYAMLLKTALSHQKPLAENAVCNWVRSEPSGIYFSRIRVWGKLIRRSHIRRRPTFVFFRFVSLCLCG
jgi:hypothetical protein